MPLVPAAQINPMMMVAVWGFKYSSRRRCIRAVSRSFWSLFLLIIFEMIAIYMFCSARIILIERHSPVIVSALRQASMLNFHPKLFAA